VAVLTKSLTLCCERGPSGRNDCDTISLISFAINNPRCYFAD